MGVFHNEGDVDANGAQEVNLRTSAGAELLGQQISTASLPVVIASDQSTIPVSVVPPAGADVFSAVGERTGVGTSEVPVILLKNPSGSGKVLSIDQILLINRHTVSSLVIFRCYSSPTITANGTAVSIPTLDIGSGNTTVAEAYQSPTISANGTLMMTTTASGGANANPNAMRFEGTLTLQPNTSILITAIADGTSRIPVVTMIWTEE